MGARTRVLIAKMLPCPFCGTSLTVKGRDGVDWFFHPDADCIFASAFVEEACREAATMWNRRNEQLKEVC